MKRVLISIGFFFATGVSFAQRIIDSTRTTVASPDKNVVVQFYQKDLSGNKREMYYQVTYKDQPVIQESMLDIQLDNNLYEKALALKVDTHARWCENLQVQKVITSSKDSSWKPVCGERAIIPDHYNAATIVLVKDDNPAYVMHVEIRAYNEGAALRYFFPEHPQCVYYRILSENTQFTLPAGTKAWFANWAQGPYSLVSLKDWKEAGERPLTLQLSNGLYACLCEAGMVDYSRTKFKTTPQKENTIVTSMNDPADLISPVGSSWRLILIGEKPGDLIEHNYMLQNLNAAGKIGNTDWIKPGKIMRVMTQTTAAAKENIDFAAKHRLQYILFDWKWYGPSFTFQSDATKVAIPDFDLPAIIQYGKEKGIGVWLYVNMQGLYAQSDSLFRIYKRWDVKGVKFGFVQVGSHRWTTWIEEMFKKAAENQIMVNVHDDWRPTGEQRTWPNLMTAEGIRGNEEMPDATHNTVLPFTRFIAGAADYTLCYYSPRIKTTHAHQLAMAAVYYSPIQTLFWYDKPSMSHDELELEFWDHIATVWDETRVLQGEPGQFITTARRKGDEWFVGTLTNNNARSIELPLNFLNKEKVYTATIYSDDPAVTTSTKVRVEKMKVTASTILNVNLLPSGGQALWIREEQ